MNNFKKIETIRNHLLAASKEASGNSDLEEIRIKIKQAVRLLEETEKKLEKHQRKEQKQKNEKKALYSQSALKMIDDEIKRQENEINSLEQRGLKRENEDIQTLLD